jgi:hypothetical protein
MKTKLTLTVDDDVVRRSKEHASRRATSLSQFVEDLLRRAVDADEPDFVDQWGGKLVWRDRPGDARMEYLKRKYGG